VGRERPPSGRTVGRAAAPPRRRPPCRLDCYVRSLELFLTERGLKEASSCDLVCALGQCVVCWCRPRCDFSPLSAPAPARWTPPGRLDAAVRRAGGPRRTPSRGCRYVRTLVHRCSASSTELGTCKVGDRFLTSSRAEHFLECVKSDEADVRFDAKGVKRRFLCERHLNEN
jgi:hypothetical protein